MTTTTVWRLRRRKLKADSDVVVEFVPGGTDGERAYFWIGKPDGRYLASVDARVLAEFVDRARGLAT